MFSETRYALNGDLRVAYRASRDRSSRHRVRPELVHELRGLSGATVPSRVGRGDDIARSADLLRPAGHRSLRSRHAGRAADLGAMGRQHHRGARRSRKSAKRSSSRSPARSRQRRCSRRHIRLAPPRWSCSRATQIRLCNALTGSIPRNCSRAWPRMWGTGEIRTCDQSGHAVERGDPGNLGTA